MRNIIYAFIFALVPLFLVAPGARPAVQEAPSAVTLTEAGILVYLSPSGEALRAHGFDIVWDAGDVYFGSDKVSIHAYGTKPPGPGGGSVTAGNFSVDRWTAELRDGDTRVDSPRVRGVEALIRKAHHLGRSARLR